MITGTLISSVVGALLGFFSSLAIFYIQERWKDNYQQKQLLNNFKRELSFNIRFFNQYKKDLQDLLNKIEADEKISFFTFNHHKIQKIFLLKALNLGILYDPLEPKDVVEIDYMLTFFSQASNEIAKTTLNAYTRGNIEKEELVEFLEQEINFLIKYKKLLKRISLKLA
ncbi:MAG: hypothetical protein ACOZAO_01130 [Patescibacteria group bacterium]